MNITEQLAEKMPNKLPELIVGITIAVFVILQILLVWNGGEYRIFNSPDAHANYFFAERIFEGLPLGYTVPFSGDPAIDYVATRSMRVINGAALPVGFIGLPILYGGISRALFLNLIPYLTIVFAAVALFSVFTIIKRMWGEIHAVISVVLLALHPAWFFYTADGLFPNVLFVSLVLAAFSIWGVAERSKAALLFFVSGLFIATALTVRLSEIVWVAPLVLYLLAIRFVQLKKLYLLMFISGVLVVSSMYLIGQAYWFPQVGVTSYQTATGSSSSLLPFGFHPRVILNALWNYIVLLMWPYFILAAIGLIVNIKSSVSSSIAKQYLLITLFVSVVICAIYGSWVIIDHPDPTHVSVAISYARYFLPLYVLLVPLASFGLLWLVGLLNRDGRGIASIVILCLLATFLYHTAIATPDEGLIDRKKILQQYEATTEWVIQSLPDNALIITNTSDKYIWPHRLVMRVPVNAQDFDAVEFFLSKNIPLYYSGVTLSEAQLFETRQQWSMHGISLSDPVFTNHDISVYQVYAVIEDDI